MGTLKITPEGQITLNSDLLLHLNVKLGEQIDYDKLPNGEVRLRTITKTHSINEYLGILANKSRQIATIEEINEAAANGWSGK
jgi:antitoxin PrlF